MKNLVKVQIAVIFFISMVHSVSAEMLQPDPYWSQLYGQPTIIIPPEQHSSPAPSFPEYNNNNQNSLPTAEPLPSGWADPPTTKQREAWARDAAKKLEEKQNKEQQDKKAVQEQEQKEQREYEKHEASLRKGTIMEIELQNGSVIRTDSYWEEQDLFCYLTFGSIIKISKNSVKTIRDAK